MGSEGRLWAALARVLEREGEGHRQRDAKRAATDAAVEADDARVGRRMDQGGASEER